MGPLCPSKPLLLGTGWGHRGHCALALCVCFLPWFLAIFFKGNKWEYLPPTHALYCLAPAAGQCRPSPCTQTSASALQPGQAGLYPHVTVPTRGGAARDSGDTFRVARGQGPW